jgi:transcriptional regulator with XRE-family HTH domain
MARTLRYAKEPLTEALPALMTARKITFRDLATASGISAGYLNHIAHGNRETPNDDILGRIAAALDVEPDYFLETRIRAIAMAMEENPALVNRLYRQVAAPEPEPVATG